MSVLQSQLAQLAFGIAVGQYRLSPGEREALSDLNAAAACADAPPGGRARPRLVPYTPTKDTPTRP